MQKSRVDIDSMVPSREGEEGFGVIEVVIVSVVISILAGVGIPAFNCVRRRAISQAAQVTIQQIKNECESNYIYGIDEFTATNPSQYQITSSGSNSCSAGTISLIPSDTNKYPTYLYKFNEGELSYNFKGQTGTSFVACNKLICGEGDSNQINLNQDFVVADTYIERGCSGYVLVNGLDWDEAEENAQKLGAHLVTVNDQDENDWLIEKLKWLEPRNPNFGAYAYSAPGGIKEVAYWIGLREKVEEEYVNQFSVSKEEQKKNLEWADGTPVDYVHQGRSDAGAADENYFALGSNGHFNDLPDPTIGSGSDYRTWWQMEYGIAEIPICN